MTTIKDIIEFDNFLNKADQQKLINYLLKPSFPYCFTYDAVRGVGVDQDIKVDDDAVSGMYHTFLMDGQICSPFFKDIEWILENFKKIDLPLANKPINRIRAGMFFKHPNDQAHQPHVDLRTDHITAVYYVNDCDGDFYLYEESNITHPFKKPTEFTVKTVASPSQGKLIVFDGNHYHASSYPNKSAVRLAITFNFLP